MKTFLSPRQTGGRWLAGANRVQHVPRAQLATAPGTEVKEDSFIIAALELSNDSSPSPTLRDSANTALKTLRMPDKRTEEYIFTDMSPLLKQKISVAPAVSDAEISAAVELCTVPEAATSRIVLVNGAISASLSNLSGLPASGVFVGDLQDAPASMRESLGSESEARGGVFATLNSSLSTGCLCISVAAGTRLETPVQIVYVSSGSQEDGVVATSYPRVLVKVEEGAHVEIIEESVAASPGQYLLNAVTEMDLRAGATASLSTVETDGAEAFSMKSTFVKQAEKSSFSMTEVRLGGVISRHDVYVNQEGPATETAMKHFLLCGDKQLHDLHTKLVLDHPDGTADQLHKCIVSSSSGRGVFDGGVKVNKQAQKTNAGQLSRNLLLAPRATVNVKPNLQIIADDVACTHGCAISDLSPEELFYFLSRGIDATAAKQALVYSFGAEVVQTIRFKALTERLQVAITGKLGITNM